MELERALGVQSLDERGGGRSYNVRMVYIGRMDFVYRDYMLEY